MLYTTAYPFDTNAVPDLTLTKPSPSVCGPAVSVTAVPPPPVPPGAPVLAVLPVQLASLLPLSVAVVGWGRRRGLAKPPWPYGLKQNRCGLSRLPVCSRYPTDLGLRAELAAPRTVDREKRDRCVTNWTINSHYQQHKTTDGVRCSLVVLQRRNTNFSLPPLAVDDIN